MSGSKAIAVLALLLLSPGAFAQDRPSGEAGKRAVVQLSEMIADYLGRIEEKLNDDRDNWTESMDLVESAAESLQSAAVLDRQQFSRAEAILRFRSAWRDEDFRRPILLRIAEVDLATDNVSQAERELLRETNQQRAAAFDALTGLVGQLKVGQQELTAYLEDKSLSKKIGQIDISSVALAIAETKALRRSLADGETVEADVEAERKRLQDAVDGFQRFLDQLDRLTNQQ